MRKYVFNEFDEPVHDVTLTITEWIEFQTLEEAKAGYAALYPELVKQFPHTQPPDEKPWPPRSVTDTIEVHRGLEQDVFYVPWRDVLAQFPDLDPTQVMVAGSGYDITCQGSISLEVLNAQLAKRGWRLIAGAPVSFEKQEPPDSAPPTSYSGVDTKGNELSFHFQDRGKRLRIS